jgi:hypothetical protein
MYVELTTDERAYREVAGWMLWKLTGQLLAELEAEGIEEPLGEPFTLACVLADLYRLADVRVPDRIVALTGEVDSGAVVVTGQSMSHS